MRAPGRHADEWDFPGARVPPRAAAEEVARRACVATVGIEAGALRGHFRFSHGFGGATVAYECHVFEIDTDDALPVGCLELRWVQPAEFCKHRLSVAAREITARLAPRVR